MTSFASRLFGFRERVDRRFYVAVGLGLMTAKYVIDASFIWLTTGRFWTPFDYLVPLISVREDTVLTLGTWPALLLVFWTLPFIWIGVSMTLRRAVDAGRSPWWCLMFFAPVLNYVVMGWLSIAPSAEHVDWESTPVVPTVVDRVRSAAAGVGAALATGVIAVLLGTVVFETYGLALFVATPFLIGLVSAFAYNRGHARTSTATLQVVALSLFLVGGSLILFALEGLLCILMAVPLGGLLAWFGGAVGRAIAIRSHAPGIAFTFLLLPVASLVDGAAPESPVQEVVTSIVIDAPPDRVWQQLIDFETIDDRPGLPFRLGIAYPVRASLSGPGVGAVRRCTFSTGDFVEPITHWDAPRRLSFDVVEQPPVLEEWSPYRTIYAPHVEGFFRSQRGEFRLVALPGGRTRLEGSTWYTLEMHPRVYWTLITEALLHRIHVRVLRQVERQAEGAEVAEQTARPSRALASTVN